MSVLIKDMEMPNNCSDCLLEYDQYRCQICGCNWYEQDYIDIGFDANKDRLPECPLFQIVHCKDCISFLNGHLCTLDRHGAIETKPDDYCSYGERL